MLIFQNDFFSPTVGSLDNFLAFTIPEQSVIGPLLLLDTYPFAGHPEIFDTLDQQPSLLQNFM